MTKYKMRWEQFYRDRGLPVPDKIFDAFTGAEFQPRAENHYEKNDGVPVAPKVEMLRPTVRQRVENLLNRGVDPLAHYVGAEGIDMDVPDDPEAELTPSERIYMDVLASELAEQAPLPDEGLPRPPSEVLTPQQPPKAAEPGVSSPPAGTPPSPSTPAAKS